MYELESESESESTLLLSEPKGSMKHTKDCTTNNDIT